MENLEISKKFRRYAAERVGLRPIWLAHGHPPPFWPHGGGQIVKIFGLYTEAESHPAAVASDVVDVIAIIEDKEEGAGIVGRTQPPPGRGTSNST